MNITGYLHTAILVSDLEKAAYFYGYVLGLTLVNRPLNFPGLWYQINEIQIHVMVHSNAQKKLCNAQKWGRNPHIALCVEDLDVAIARLKSYHCPIQMSASGRPAFFTQDLDGNIIEINQA